MAAPWQQPVSTKTKQEVGTPRRMSNGQCVGSEDCGKYLFHGVASAAMNLGWDLHSNHLDPNVCLYFTGFISAEVLQYFIQINPVI
jgi:hypothetical protein